MTTSSFYTDGGTYDTAVVTSNDTPGNSTPSQAPSSFYPDGTQYNELANSDTLTAEFTADLQAAAASATTAATQAIAAAAAEGIAQQNATAAANSASAAATSATNAASSASTATNEANTATTQATNASASASNAFTNATSAASSASAASTSATNAAASATTATTEANTATTQAGNAASSATAAASSASSASTSATNAATSATNAASAVQAAAGTVTPVINGTAAVGTSTKWAHEDHVHPTDTTRAPTASPTFTGTVTIPTAAPGDNSTKAASTAFIAAALSAYETVSALATTLASYVTSSSLATTLASYAQLASPTFTGTPAAPTATGGTNTTQLATCQFVQSALLGVGSVIRSYLAGLQMSTAGSSSTISISAGVAADSTNAVMMSLASAMSKTTSAWASGSGNGALDTGTIAASTWYHAHLIFNGTTVDVLASLSATAPTLPSGYTRSRRIGSMKTDASSHWVGFSQNGDEFLWSTSAADDNPATVTTTASLLTLSVPSGIKVNALFRARMGSTSAANAIFTSPDETDQAASVPQLDLSSVASNFSSGRFSVRTNTSAQIRVRSDQSSGVNMYIGTFGWIDSRGRDS